jgi:hypothetical protein
VADGVKTATIAATMPVAGGGGRLSTADRVDRADLQWSDYGWCLRWVVRGIPQLGVESGRWPHRKSPDTSNRTYAVGVGSMLIQARRTP